MYGQYCPIARASEILAERWTLIIVRNLLAGCRTFSELCEGAPGIPKDTLTQRLELLEQFGVIMSSQTGTCRRRAEEPQGQRSHVCHVGGSPRAAASART